MSVSVVLNGTTYTIPQTDETGWGAAVTSFLQAVGTSTLQPSGGAFTLTADVDFGANFGLKSLYYKSRNANIASTGQIRLGSAESLVWRNNANSGNLILTTDASDNLLYNGHIIESSSGVVPVVDGGTGFSSYTTGDTLYASGSTALSKLAIGTTSQALIVVGGLPAYGTLPLLGGGTGQTTKAPAFDALQPMTTSGDIIYGGASGTGTRLPKGSDTQVLTLASGLPSWANPASSPTNNYYSGYTAAAGNWTRTATSYGDGTNTGGNALTSRVSSGITVTAGASNVAGITWTPSSSSAVYFVTATSAMQNSVNTTQSAMKLTDGTINVAEAYQQGATGQSEFPITVMGVYAPGTGSAVTLKIQIKTDTGGTAQLKGGFNVSSIEWTVLQIK